MRFLTEILAKAGITSNYVQLDTLAATPGGAPGRIVWNDVDGTLEFQMKGGNVTQQIGQELPVLVKHADNTGLTNGKVVYQFSSDGANVTVKYASASSETTASKTFGVMTEDATGGAKGFCTTFGYVRNINTSALTEGAMIWLSETPGEMTTTRPTQPAHGVVVGRCIRQHATEGVIFVSIQNGFELDELHDVLITSKTNNDFIVYESATNLWKNKTISAVLGYTPANGANYLALTGGTLTGDLTLSGVNPRLYFTDTDNNPDYFISNTDGTFTVYDVTNSVGRFKIYSTGNAEFTSNVSINGTVIGTDQTFGGAYRTFAFGANSNSYNRIFATTDASDGLYLNAAAGQGINFRVNGGGSNVFSISSTGAATFSSSVTAGGTISATNADIYSQNGTGSNLSIGFKQSDAVKFRLRYDISGDTVSMVGSSGNFIQTWSQSGNVGINTTSPSKTLHVYTTGNEGIFLQGTGGGVWMNIQSAAGNLWSIGAQNDGMGVYNRTSSLYAFFIKDNRQLQLPSYTASSSYSGTAAGYLAFDSSGNVITVAGVAATDNTKLPLTGGSLTGRLNLLNTDSVDFALYHGAAASGSARIYYNQPNNQLRIYATAITSDATTGIGSLALYNGSAYKIVLTEANVGSYALPLSGGTLSGGITFTAPGGSVLLKHAVSEVDAWIFQENAANWGLYWKNAPSGHHTFGGYTTVGAELVGMSAANASGNGVLTSNFVGATTAYAQWMISNYTGYIWSASTIFAAGDFTSPTFNSTSIVNISGSNNTPINITGAAHKYLTINPGNGYEAMVRYIGGSGSSWYVGKRTSGQLIGTESFHFYSEAAGATVGGINPSGDMIVTGSMRAPIFYDSNDTGYYGDFAGTSNVWGLAIRGDNGASSTANQIFFWGGGNTTTSAIGFKSNAGYFGNPTGFGDGYNTYFTMDTVGRGWVFRRGVGGSDFGAAYTAGWILNNGIWQANSEMRAPVFRFTNSSNNAYLTGNSDWGFRVVNDSGYIQFGPANGTWAHIYSGLPFYFNQALYVNGTQVVTNSGTWGINITGSAATATDSTKLPLSGGTLTGALLMGTGVAAAGNSQPTALSYGLLQGWGGFVIAGDTDGSQSEYVVITAGYGVASATAANGLAIGYNALTWKNNTIWHSGNAPRANYSNLMYYAGFTLDANAMPMNSNGFTYAQNAPYTGPIMNFGDGGYAMQLNGTYGGGGTQIAYRTRNGDAGSWNSWYTFITSANIGSQSVSYASSAGAVAWSNVSSKPAGWLNTTNLIDDNTPGDTVGYIPSGFYQNYAGTGNPTGTWFNYINVRHSNPGNNHGFQLGMSYYDSNLYFRSYRGGGTTDGWSRALGTMTDPYPSNMNQYVRTSDTPTFQQVYSYDYFRSYGNSGWYNQDYSQGIRTNTPNSSYGTIITLGGGTNGWNGYTTQNNYFCAWMHDSSGNNGFYQQNGRGWILFFNYGNNCWGIGTDNTYSGDGFRCIKYGSAEYGWTTWSDRRAKENITPITSALDTVLGMRGVYYNYIKDEAKSQHVGFIAQELMEILPQSVRYADEIDEYNINYGPIVSVLAEAIKEQDAKMQLQEEKIALLQAQLQTLLN